MTSSLALHCDTIQLGDQVKNVGNNNVCVYRKLGLEMRGRRRSSRNDRMYIEDLEDPDEIRPPACNLGLVACCVDGSKERVSFPLFVDLLADFRYSPEAMSQMSQMKHSMYALLE